MNEYKTCSVCKQTLPFTAFGVDKKSSSGLRSNCKACRTVESKLYREKYPEKKAQGDRAYRLANKAKIRETKKRYRSLDPERWQQYGKQYRAENFDRIAESKRDWNLRNADRLAEMTSAWKQANPEKVREYKRAYKRRNPDKDKQYYQQNKWRYEISRAKRRALKAKASIYLITSKDVSRIMSRPCIYCGAKAEHLDHVIPLSKGGLHSVGNLAPACAKCNLSKGAKFIVEWKYR